LFKKNEIVKIHLIVLFCSIEDGLDSNDIKAMEKIINCFGKQTNMAICITRAEKMSEQDRNDRIQELEKEENFKKLLETVNHRILFMGAVNPKQVTSEENLKDVMEQVAEDRLFFLNYIFTCRNPTRIEDLDFVRSKKNEMKKKVGKFNKRG